MTVLIGIGTGRCGTLSLCTLLNRQNGVAVTHETRPLLSWSGSDRQTVIDRLYSVREAAEDAGMTCWGDISFFNLNYLPVYFELFPEVKVVYLYRKEEDVVRSYLRKLRKWPIVNQKPVNHWTDSPKRTPTEFDKCFPHYDENLFDAISRYCREYRTRCEEIKAGLPQESFYEMETDDLSISERVECLFDWLGLDPPFQSLQCHEVN